MPMARAISPRAAAMRGGVAILEGGFEIGRDGRGAVEKLRGIPESGFKGHFWPPLDHEPFVRKEI